MNYTGITLRPVTEQDAATLRTIAALCPPLDVHTPYTYWVISHFFGDISFLLEQETENGQFPIGYITALETPKAVFIWQIGLLPEYRGQKLSQLLIGAVYEQAQKLAMPLCTTIDDDNISSRAAFGSFCAKNSLSMQPVGTVTLQASDIPGFYETESLYQIT